MASNLKTMARGYDFSWRLTARSRLTFWEFKMLTGVCGGFNLLVTVKVSSVSPCIFEERAPLNSRRKYQVMRQRLPLTRSAIRGDNSVWWMASSLFKFNKLII
jgi:hypothetical protein